MLGTVKLSPACKLDHPELGEYKNSGPKNHKSEFDIKRGDKLLVTMSAGFILLGTSFKQSHSLITSLILFDLL